MCWCICEKNWFMSVIPRYVSLCKHVCNFCSFFFLNGMCVYVCKWFQSRMVYRSVCKFPVWYLKGIANIVFKYNLMGKCKKIFLINAWKKWKGERNLIQFHDTLEQEIMRNIAVPSFSLASNWNLVAVISTIQCGNKLEYVQCFVKKVFDVVLF